MAKACSALSLEDVSQLAPCIQEEASTRMILHVADAVKSGYVRIVRSVDTDVLVLAVALVQKLQEQTREHPTMGSIWHWYQSVLRFQLMRLPVPLVRTMHLLWQPSTCSVDVTLCSASLESPRRQHSKPGTASLRLYLFSSPCPARQLRYKMTGCKSLSDMLFCCMIE